MERTRNIWFLSAAALMALTTGVHVFAGGPEIYAPLRLSTLAPVPLSVMSVVWHVVTVILLVFTFGLASLGLAGRNWPLFWVIWATLLGLSGLFIGYGLADLGTLWPMPQWTIFLAMAALMWRGARAW